MTSELSLKDIETKLNSIFDGGERLIFWYDAEGSFEDSIEQMELRDVKIHRLDPDNADVLMTCVRVFSQMT